MSTDPNPLRGLERLQRQLEDALESWDGERFDGPRTRTTASRMGVDLVDRGDEFVVTVDVPGFDVDDIDLRLADETVYVTAKRERTEHEAEDEDELYLRSERTRRTVRRSARLPESVAEDGAEATYENGVLTVTLPKTEPTDLDGETIDIRTEGSA